MSVAILSSIARFVLACLTEPAPPAVHSVAVTAGVEYGRGATRQGDKPLLLDIYRLDSPCAAPRPLVARTCPTCRL